MLVTWRTPADYRPMPWKNGGGTTTELAIYPARAAVTEPFVWRFSLANLTASGPFSVFAGYDRLLLQTAGQPMRLDHGEQGSTELSPHAAHRFSGDWSTYGTLGSGPAQDLNLMVRRDVAHGSMELLNLAQGEARALEVTAAFTLLYLLQGQLTVRHPRPDVLEPGAMLQFVADPLAVAAGAPERCAVTLEAAQPVKLVWAEVSLHGGAAP